MKARMRQPLIDAYQYTGVSMDAAVATLLGINNCAAAAGTRPALVRTSGPGSPWMELRPTMWIFIQPWGVEIKSNRDAVLNYRDATTDPVVLPAVDPGPDVYP